MTPSRLSRRQALSAAGTVGLGTLLAACGGDDEPAGAGVATTTDDSTSRLLDESASCTLTPELTEGPYYFDADSIRSNIREDREGLPLRLALRVREAGGRCEPIRNAVVDIWHSDALGEYSGFGNAEDERFLRGAQATNRAGAVEFLTVYPGWYQGRAPHIHAKVHLDRRAVLTTQLFFDDAVSASVYRRAPYSRRGEPDQTNASDGISDEALVLTTKKDGRGLVGAMTFEVEA